MLNLKVFILVVTVTTVAGGRASQYTRLNLKLQQDRATKLLSCNISKIYVYDASGYFTGATRATACDERVLVKGGQIALLDEASQQIFTNFNEYNQFSEIPFRRDNIGLYNKTN